MGSTLALGSRLGSALLVVTTMVTLGWVQRSAAISTRRMGRRGGSSRSRPGRHAIGGRHRAYARRRMPNCTWVVSRSRGTPITMLAMPSPTTSSLT